MTSSWFEDYRAALLELLHVNMTMKNACGAAAMVADHLAEKRKELDPEPLAPGWTRKVGAVASSEILPPDPPQAPLPTPEDVAKFFCNQGHDELTWSPDQVRGVIRIAIREDRARRGIK